MFIPYCVYVFIPLKERINLITFNDGSVIAVNVMCVTFGTNVTH